MKILKNISINMMDDCGNNAKFKYKNNNIKSNNRESVVKNNTKDLFEMKIISLTDRTDKDKLNQIKKDEGINNVNINKTNVTNKYHMGNILQINNITYNSKKGN